MFRTANFQRPCVSTEKNTRFRKSIFFTLSFLYNFIPLLSNPLSCNSFHFRKSPLFFNIFGICGNTISSFKNSFAFSIIKNIKFYFVLFSVIPNLFNLTVYFSSPQLFFSGREYIFPHQMEHYFSKC